MEGEGCVSILCYVAALHSKPLPSIINSRMAVWIFFCLKQKKQKVP